MSTLSGATVLIVGGGSGIGLAAARLAAEQGARVTIAGRSAEKLATAAANIGSAGTLAFDMTDREAVDRAVPSAIPSGGAIDHLVLTAVGNEYALFAPLAALTAEQVERSLDKFRGFFNVVRAAAPHLAARASVTLLSGAGAMKPPRETALAAAANGSVVSLGKALAIELAPVRVNVVMPGVVDTAIHGAGRDRLEKWAESDLPARRFGKPEDIGQAILFLMTNPYMTGHTLIVDGGFVVT